MYSNTWETGTYVLQVQKNTGTSDAPVWTDVQGASATVTISGTIGQLASPEIQADAQFPSTDGISFKIGKVEHAGWYNMILYHLENGEVVQDYQNYNLKEWKTNTIAPDSVAFQENTIYYLEVTAWQNGYDRGTATKVLFCGDLSGITPFRMTLPTSLVTVEAEAFDGIDLRVVLFNGPAGADLSFLNDCGTVFVVTDVNVSVPDSAVFQVLSTAAYNELTGNAQE